MPTFSHPKNLVDWYDNQERVLTPAFLDTIPWHDISNHEIDSSFFPILIYFRDVEKFTDVYFRQLKHTPTGRDPHIRQFMEKWRQEEDLHGELLNRFLNEAGHYTPPDWSDRAKKTIPTMYHLRSFVNGLLANCIGERFSAVHMTWGAINEMSTLTGYRRLWTLAKHPVLEYILRAIAREEAIHSFFYHSLAKMKLQQSKFAQELSRYIICKFWTPVGQGSKPASDTNLIIKTLFDGEEGAGMIDTYVNKHIERLPGFHGCQKINDHIGGIIRSEAPM